MRAPLLGLTMGHAVMRYVASSVALLTMSSRPMRLPLLGLAKPLVVT